MGALSANLDLADAVMNILVCPEDFPLFGFTWEAQWPNGTTWKEYYMSLFLPFGLHSSSVLFNSFLDALEYAKQVNCTPDLLHSLDNQALLHFQDNVDMIVQMSADFGFAINPR